METELVTTTERLEIFNHFDKQPRKFKLELLNIEVSKSNLSSRIKTFVGMQRLIPLPTL